MPKEKTTVELYDTTLRDGTQAEGFVLSPEDKLKVARRLDRLGVAYIEGGWPGSNPRDQEFFARAGELELANAKLVAFGSTHHASRTPENDPNLAALIAAPVEICALVGKSWARHVTAQLKIPLERNLEITTASVAHMIAAGRRVFFDAEHFFDGLAEDPDYTMSVLKAAVEGGAEALVLCDTNGGSLPAWITEGVAKVKAAFPGVTIGIHVHNDGDMATANTLAAVAAGATQVQGTTGGMGERCGNADLTSVAPALELKMGCTCLPPDHLRRLTETARFIREQANQPPAAFAPYVGTSAFSHKGGLHISAVEKDPSLYEHVNPEAVGNARRYLLSDLAGRAALLKKLADWGYELSPDDPRLKELLSELKERENEGYVYEAAEASLELLVNRRISGRPSHFFDLLGFRVADYKQAEHTPPQAEATVRVRVEGVEEHTAALGDGPVNALDRAVRKALVRFYPALNTVRLEDYKVRVLAGSAGTEARVRVLVESGDGENRWGTVGVSFDVLEASWQALGDGIRYKLFKMMQG
ncbi:MAG: citramalate synthase [Desulfarculaceae bacterium]|nr:citramalate synthase [Desulfarculaceae bacterium]MCF8049081.1 citramalate synthase [Desulfarculaceae bacterium]MCF8123960.1 citramalate synthase [Desulfarculaceae bacterium]